MNQEETEPCIRRTGLAIVAVGISSALGMLALIGWGAIELIGVTSK